MSFQPLARYLPYITNEPEVSILWLIPTYVVFSFIYLSVHKISPSDRYVVISTDGLYEHLTPEMVAEIVEKYLYEDFLPFILFLIYCIHLETNTDGGKIASILIEKQFEEIGKKVGKTAEQVKQFPNRKTFMDDTSVIVLIFNHNTNNTNNSNDNNNNNKKEATETRSPAVAEGNAAE